MQQKYKETEATVDVVVSFLQCPVCESYEVVSRGEGSDECTEYGTTWSPFCAADK